MDRVLDVRSSLHSWAYHECVQGPRLYGCNDAQRFAASNASILPGKSIRMVGTLGRTWPRTPEEAEDYCMSNSPDPAKDKIAGDYADLITQWQKASGPIVALSLLSWLSVPAFVFVWLANSNSGLWSSDPIPSPWGLMWILWGLFGAPPLGLLLALTSRRWVAAVCLALMLGISLLVASGLNLDLSELLHAIEDGFNPDPE